MKIVFSTPAFKRFDVSAICFRQHAWCHAELAKRGIESTSVVVADDKNLDLAREHGFEIVKRDNKYLGRKFNDGYQRAHKLGADYVVPLGSDSWVHPSYFTLLVDLKDNELLTGKHYALIHENGAKLGRLEINVANGVGPHVIPLPLLEKSRYRPVQENLARGCDGSLLAAIGREVVWRWNDNEPLQYVAFRTTGQQLNPYENLAKKYLRSETKNHWRELKKFYPADLVGEAEKLYEERRRGG